MYQRTTSWPKQQQRTRDVFFVVVVSLYLKEYRISEKIIFVPLGRKLKYFVAIDSLFLFSFAYFFKTRAESLFSIHLVCFFSLQRRI